MDFTSKEITIKLWSRICSHIGTVISKLLLVKQNMLYDSYCNIF